jgi:hypothetical protein
VHGDIRFGHNKVSRATRAFAVASPWARDDGIDHAASARLAPLCGTRGLMRRRV